MKRFLWPLPIIILAVVGCGRSEPTSKEKAAAANTMVEADPPIPKTKTDYPVPGVVEGPAVVFVIQTRRVRALIEVPAGSPGTKRTVNVPIGAINDGSGPLYVGVLQGTTIKGKNNVDYCPICQT